MKTIHPFHKQRGFAIFDNMISLAVTVVLLLGVLAYAAIANGFVDKFFLMRDVQGLRTAVVSSVGGANYGVAVLNADLIQSDDVPSSLTNDGVNVITNKWGGAVTITGANTNFTIRFAAIPQNICTKSVAPANGFISVAVNGAAALVPPVTMAQATAACNAAANTIVWTAN